MRRQGRSRDQDGEVRSTAGEAGVSCSHQEHEARDRLVTIINLEIYNSIENIGDDGVSVISPA